MGRVLVVVYCFLLFCWLCVGGFVLLLCRGFL